ncbi:hypothetical protein L6Q96_21650 [Candidatus Binatia bacterium]|nr:hypothetical protein [Candidatus Binatia bacterium]
MTMPHRTRFAACVLAALLIGCGPGSSGFDVVPESAAIDAALRKGECVSQRALQICPAGVAGPGRGPETVATEDAGPATCIGSDVNYACAFTLPFTPSGFPPAATYRLAAREPVPGQGWAIGLAVSQSAPDQPNAGAPVTVDFMAPTEPQGFATQFAILVFLDGGGELPPQVDTLAETGADFAFVTPPVTLSTNLDPQ